MSGEGNPRHSKAPQASDASKTNTYLREPRARGSGLRLDGRACPYLLTTRAGRPLDQCSSLKVLHAAGHRGGFDAFRRFRFAVLRWAGVPNNLIKQWMAIRRT